MSSNSCLFPINFVILCQGDLKKKDKPKFTTSLIKTLQWLPIVLRIHFAGKAGSPFMSLQPWALPLPSTHTSGVTYFRSYHYLQHLLPTQDFWRQPGFWFTVGSPWILAEWLTGSSYVKKETLKHPAGRTSSACHSMAPTGAGEPTLAKPLLQVQQLILFATHSKNSPVLEIWTGYLILTTC